MRPRRTGVGKQLSLAMELAMPEIYFDVHAMSEHEWTRLESLIREDFERCHPGDTLEDLKRRASFSREDKGLLPDWMAVAACRARQSRVP